MLLQVSWLGTGTNSDQGQVQREENHISGLLFVAFSCIHSVSQDRISVDSNFVLCGFPGLFLSLPPVF